MQQHNSANDVAAQVTENLKHVSTVFDNVNDGVGKFAQNAYTSLNSNIPVERVKKLKAIVEQLDETTRITFEFCGEASKRLRPLSCAQRGITGCLTLVAEAHKLKIGESIADAVGEELESGQTSDQDAPLEDATLEELVGEPLPELPEAVMKRLKRRMKMKVNEFWTNAKLADTDALQYCVDQLTEIEKRWMTLAKLVDEEAGAWTVLEEKFKDELKRLQRWCYFGAAACVLGGIALTVGAAFATGGASLVVEAGVIAGATAVAVGCTVATKVAPEHCKALANQVQAKTGLSEGQLNVVTTVATCGVSILAASIKQAQDLCNMSTKSAASTKATHEGIQVIIEQLHALKAECGVIQRQCRASGEGMKNCITVWEKASEQFSDIDAVSIDQQVNTILEEILCKNDAQLITLTDEFVLLETRLASLDGNLQKLHETTLQAYRNFTEPQGSDRSMHDILMGLVEWIDKNDASSTGSASKLQNLKMACKTLSKKQEPNTYTPLNK